MAALKEKGGPVEELSLVKKDAGLSDEQILTDTNFSLKNSRYHKRIFHNGISFLNFEVAINFLQGEESFLP